MRKCLIIGVLLILSPFCFGQYILSEDFEFSGDLVGNNGWIHNTGTTNPLKAITPSLVFPNYPGSGMGNSVAVNGISGEDAYKTFPSRLKLYYSFLINVTQSTNTAKNGYVTFLGKEQSTGVNGGINGNYYARIAIQTSIDGTWKLGTSNWSISNTSNPSAYSTNAYNKNQTYAVIISFDMTDNYTIKIWIKSTSFPSSESEAGAPDIVFTGAPNTAALPKSVDLIALRQDVTSPSIIMDGLRVFDNWGMIVLPIKISSFNARTIQNRNIVLDWQIVPSKTVKSFEVERSSKESFFKSIATIPYSSDEVDRKFNYTDYNVENDVNLYRIKILDMDGKFMYSSILKIELVPKENIRIVNIGAKMIKIIIPSTPSSSRIHIYDFNGTLQKTILVNKNESELWINLSTLSKGCYIAQLQQTASTLSQKFVLP